MATENKYKVIVAAQINTANIQAELDKLAGKYKINLDIQMGGGNIEQAKTTVKNQVNEIRQSAIQQTQASENSLLINLPKEVKTLNEARDHITQVLNSMKNVEKIKIVDTTAGGNEGMISATIKYTDSVGKARTETLRWKLSMEEVEGQMIPIVDQLKTITNSTMDYAKVEKELANALDLAAKSESRMAGRKTDVSEVKNVLSLSSQLRQSVAKANLPSATQEDIAKVRTLTKELKSANMAVGNLGKDTLTFGKAMKVALERIMEWGLATAVIYGAKRQFEEMVDYVKELDAALTDVQIVTGETDAYVASLADSYNQLAKEVGGTTLEVAESSLTWVRQGKSIEDSYTLTKDAMMMSKLAAVESGDASEYLTSIMNGYKLSVDEVTDALDKMLAVDNASATSVAELSQALSRTTNIANEAGVSFENLTAYIGTVSSVTRKSAIKYFGAL